MFRLLRTFCPLLLLALWLPATSHCAIGAATDWFTKLCASCCEHEEHSGDENAADAHDYECSLAESGDYSTSSTSIPVPQPTLNVLVCLDCLHDKILAEAEPVSPPLWTKDHPAEWVPTWVFASRAALPARAPNLI